MKPKFYLTTPIYYVNGSPHIGHAYTSTAADVLARWKRLDGYDVFFLTGTDEHGQKVEKAAQTAGIDPQSFADGVSAEFRAMAQTMGISNDDFIRTTEERHKHACQVLWQRLVERGQIYLGAYEGWYAMRDEAFYGEDELTEKDGIRIAAATGSPVEWVREPSYFFKLSAWGDKLLELYDTTPDFVGPQARRNEVVSFVKQGLTDLSISRTSFSWGIKVPGDESHVMYVWLDALMNYLSAVGFPDENASRAGFWPADVHLVGKEIVRFHAIYWPAFLMAADLPLPKKVYSHGWWTIEGEKMSKSIGNVIAPADLVSEFGLDAVRFFLLREVPFGGDGDFKRKALITRNNVELANDLGNLAQRSLSLIAKNCGAALPALGELIEDDHALLTPANDLTSVMREKLDRLAFSDALEDAWKLIRAGNSYIDRQAPWALKKTDITRMNTVLRVLADLLRIVATNLQPYMPQSMSKMLDQLGVPLDARDLASLAQPLPDATPLPAPQGVFPRYVEEVA